MTDEGVRLQKVLAELGYGSRRQIEGWITEGRIVVNSEVATLGQRVSPKDTITLDGKPVRQPVAPIDIKMIAIHKPDGIVCTRHDPEDRETVFSLLPNLRQGRWIMIGRLDINTSGLLLFTTDGDMAHRLMHPSFEIEREYAVRIFGEVTQEQLDALQKGVELEDGEAKFNSIVDGGGEGMNHWYHVTLSEGRNREVRRLWESQGLTVSRLMRVRYGCFAMPSILKQGKWAWLEEAEINALREQVQLPPMKKKSLAKQGHRRQANRVRQQNQRRRSR